MNASERDEWRVHRLAVYQGRKYRFWKDPADASLVGLYPEPGCPAPDDLPRGSNPAGAPMYLVGSDRLDAAYESRWFFEWHGGRFEATGGQGTGFVSGNLVSPLSMDFIRKNGLTVYEQYVAGGRFALDEVTDLHEERTDLLAQWKERHGE
ncbi:hypothetical protein KGA66_12380 [Actinocrinis puniceicyclus]|uniref:Uncharacterized protein n=1 Tax=Actinocrinis puniceicyclus TaxID=977794 RepID=A0A8J8BBB0_9ACTN|nr:hypothetical protein [Actinocrinis puniceicyclus]MBS2963847.1 hypothetical protein [Actinocrinis puniceicyclus]